MTGYAFAADIGSTYTKGVVFDTASAEIVCSGQVPTPASGDVGRGFDRLRRELGRRSGAGSFDVSFSSSSARGGLKVVALGLTPGLTAKAASMACLNAGGRLLACYSHRIGEATVREIEGKDPDIILLAGGTDGGDSCCVLHNARKLSALKGPSVLYAGNAAAADEVRSVFGGSSGLFFSENVLPELGVLNIEPAREKIREIFLSRIISGRGLERVADCLDSDILPTPGAVLRAVWLISGHFYSTEGRGDCLAVDVGGSTTDVYSAGHGMPAGANTVLSGLPEPYFKRTVEGDTGIRSSAGGIGPGGDDNSPGDGGPLRGWVARILARPDALPESEEELSCDAELAARAGATALRRHCGCLRQQFSPAGRYYVQEGKDLRGVDRIFATGGVFSRNRHAAAALGRELKKPGPERLVPRSAHIIPDRDYVMFAAGLIASCDRELALAALKKSMGREGNGKWS